jgi:C4-type Zn-finger protein
MILIILIIAGIGIWMTIESFKHKIERDIAIQERDEAIEKFKELAEVHRALKNGEMSITIKGKYLMSFINRESETCKGGRMIMMPPLPNSESETQIIDN